MKSKIAKISIGTLIFAATLALVIGSFVVGNPADDMGHPSAKATCKAAEITLVGQTEDQDWTTIMSNTIKCANKKDLFVDVSLECGLYTQTLVKSKGGTKDTSKAEAKIQVKVLVNGVEAYPGKVVFDERMQQLSATLEGMIAGCLIVDPQDPNNVIIDPNCDVTPEEIELIQRTMSAHSFNFIAEDLESGVYLVEVMAKVTTGTSAQTGSASAWALVGKGSVTVEEVRCIKGEDILID